MATLTTASLELPRDVIYEMNKKVQEQSVIAALVNAEMQTFTDKEYMVFTQEPEAEYVGEGAAKSSSDVAFTPIQATPHKLQVTVRTTDEVRWADEDGQLEVIDLITGAFAGALARGIDSGALFAVDPKSKAQIASMKKSAIVLNANQVISTATTDKQVLAELDGLADSVIADYDVNGIALDRVYANQLRKLRNSNDVKLFPELGMDLKVSSLDGLRAVVSGAVANRKFASTPTGVKAIVGNWDLIKYGIVRNIAITPIEYGDPDGRGDLKRYNQIAWRAETVFSFANFDPTGFAVLTTTSQKPADDGGDDDDGDEGDKS